MNYVSINIMGWKIESSSIVHNRKIFVWHPSVYAHFLKFVSCKPCHESRWPVQSLVFPADQCSSCWYTALKPPDDGRIESEPKWHLK